MQKSTMHLCPRVMFVGILFAIAGCGTMPAGALLGVPPPISQDIGLWVVTLLKGGSFGIQVGGGIIRGLNDGDAIRDIDSGGFIAESNDLMVVSFESSTSLYKNGGIPFARLQFQLRGIRQPDGSYQGSWTLSNEQGGLIAEDSIIITRL